MTTPNRRQAMQWAACVSATTLAGAAPAGKAGAALFNVLEHSSVAAAVDKLNKAGGGTLYFPAGAYQIDQPIDIELAAGAGVAVRGDGPGLSTIVSKGDGGLKFRFKPAGGWSSSAGAIVIDGLSVLASGNGSQAGISLRCEGGASPAPKKLIRDVILAGWAIGIDCIDCTFVTIDGIDYQGAGVAIRFSGEHDPVDNHIRGLRVFGARTGIEVDGTCEGIYVEQSTFLGVERGIHWHTTHGEPLLSLTGSHISASRECILGHNLIQPIITGNLLYQATSDRDEWAGIRLSAESPSIYDLIQVSHNTIHGFPGRAAQRRRGIVIAGRRGGLVQGNIVHGVEAGIVLEKNTSEFKVAGNIVRGAKDMSVIDRGRDNVISP